METVELNKRNREAARLVSRTNAAGKVVMVPGGNPKLKSGTQEVRVILTDYVSLEGAFRKIVIQEKFDWGKKNKRARDDDESKTIREFLRGVWLVFSGGLFNKSTHKHERVTHRMWVGLSDFAFPRTRAESIV